MFNLRHRRYEYNTISLNNRYWMNIEEVLFVIFDREPDSFQLNEVHRHRMREENNTAMMDQKSDHSSRPIRLPRMTIENRLIFQLKRSIFTSGQLRKLSVDRIERRERRSLNVFKSLCTLKAVCNSC